jgi:DNA mismatch endonuclease (patch repair protein)
LPGKPDLVFGPRRKIIFVHGCFWHSHDNKNCSDSRAPKSNLGYWEPKLARNKERDAEHLRSLEKLGWQSHIIWECETRDIPALKARLNSFLLG